MPDEEPPVGAVVRDKDGILWRGEPFGWVFELEPGRWDSGPGAGLSWSSLVRHYGPVTMDQQEVSDA